MAKLTTRKLAQAAAVCLGSSLLASGPAVADIIHPDDVIIQFSLCVGSDCVNGEAFNFDTIRMKENNTRIGFMDTSGAGFPTRDWRIEANSSAGGGASYLALKDMGDVSTGAEGGTAILTVTAGAPANSLFVSSTGRVGIRTAAPVLDLHIATGNTPAIRLEQNGSSGFTPQTWDIAGNEASFFIRDVTGGSLLPFRIFPGAASSTLAVAGSSNVGVGTLSPGKKLDVNGDIRLRGDNATLNFFRTTTPTDIAFIAYDNAANNFDVAANNKNLRFLNELGFAESMRISSTGNVGIGATAPAAQLHTTGTVRFAGVANCAAGIVSDADGDLSCSASTRHVKNISGALTPSRALANVMALKPQVGAYKKTPDEPEHWLIAEEVAEVDPALVGLKDGEPFTVKTYGVVADLVAVIQLQQRQIEAQQARFEAQQRRIEALELAAAKE